MKLVVDASVAIKWVVEEEGRASARALVLADHELIAPDFLLVEAANVMWKKVRRRELGSEQASKALGDMRLPLAQLLPMAGLVDRALDIAVELDHPVYDCLYVSAAEKSDCAVVTADRRLLGVVRGSAFSARVADLAEIAA